MPRGMIWLVSLSVALGSGWILGRAPGEGVEGVVLGAGASASTLGHVKERGVLRAGVRKDLRGFGSVDEKGQIVGFDIDLAREIAGRLKVRLEVLPVTPATRVPLLLQNRVDLVAATMTHYRKRDEVVDFSIGYFFSAQKLLVRRTSGIRTIADMAGRRAGTAIGAEVVAHFLRAQPRATVQTFEGYPEAFLAMERGLVDAVVGDIVILAGLRAGVENPHDYVLTADFPGGGAFAVGVRENDSKWRDAINVTLQDIWTDGTWDRLFDRWLGPRTSFGLRKEDIGFTMTVWD